MYSNCIAVFEVLYCWISIESALPCCMDSWYVYIACIAKLHSQQKFSDTQQCDWKWQNAQWNDFWAGLLHIYLDNTIIIMMTFQESHAPSSLASQYIDAVNICTSAIVVIFTFAENEFERLGRGGICPLPTWRNMKTLRTAIARSMILNVQ